MEALNEFDDKNRDQWFEHTKQFFEQQGRKMTFVILCRDFGLLNRLRIELLKVGYSDAFWNYGNWNKYVVKEIESMAKPVWLLVERYKIAYNNSPRNPDDAIDLTNENYDDILKLLTDNISSINNEST